MTSLYCLFTCVFAQVPRYFAGRHLVSLLLLTICARVCVFGCVYVCVCAACFVPALHCALTAFDQKQIRQLMPAARKTCNKRCTSTYLSAQ